MPRGQEYVAYHDCRVHKNGPCLRFITVHCNSLFLLYMSYLPSIPDYHGIEANLPNPGLDLHANIPGIQANLPGSRILRKNPTFHSALTVHCNSLFLLYMSYLPSIPDYHGIEANLPNPGLDLHANIPGIQANLPGSRILRKNPTFHSGLASCARNFCRTALQCSQVRAWQHA